MKVFDSDIDFADSHYKATKYENSNLTVKIISWDEKIISIIFFNVIKFIYKDGSIIDSVYEDVTENSFLSEALALYYNNLIPEHHLFKRFIIIDIEDYPIFEVVAEKISISKL